MRISALLLLASTTIGCSQQVTSADAEPSNAALPPSATPIGAAEATGASGATSRALAHGITLPVRVFAPNRANGAVVASAAHGSTSDDSANAIARDASSNVFVAGRLGGNADIGCGMHPTPAGAAYVSKTTPDGTCAWAVYLDADWISPSAITVGNDGSVYVTGGFAGNATFDTVHASAGGTDGFIVKITSAGTIAWARTFGGADEDYAYALAVTPSGVTVGGGFYATTSFGDAGNGSWTSFGDADAFLATFDAASGAYVASRAFGGAGWDSVNSIAFDANAGLIASGTHAGGLDLGLGSVESAGGQDGFVVTYDAQLVTRAARSFGGHGDDAAHGATVDSGGRIVISGYFMGSADIGAPGNITGNAAHTAFWAAYDASLAFGAAGTLDSDGDVVVEAIAARPGGGIVIGGHFTGTTATGTPMTAGPSRAGFVAAYGANGMLAWSTPIRASADTMILGLASSASAVVAVGFSDGTLECAANAVNAGGADVVAVTLGD
jgi:hypothetical protein